ncbi:peptide-methionine (S)-S-oxide reductase MsrA [Stakelama marina]|uniref:Peptide methionine sulfoxide reductase MsrA n=1 Tax=Stakelama marina TaxID=2826939 RepID=A0A8T4IIM5_9SPHN|nr:peptide-methionine (S)-S-oxide reductase MsrA [Stakelama marina]
MPKSLFAIAGAGLLAAAALNPAGGAERAVPVPAPAFTMAKPHGLQTAVLAGGCFWGMEAVFEHVKGVKSVTNGYAGGKASTASYAKVGTEKTGHAEAVKITYDPGVVSYGTLLRIYFSVAHDPTQLNRQGPDRGPSYRSAIFPQNNAQKMVAARYIEQLRKAGTFGKPIVTRLEGGRFYPAERYHQDYYRKHPNSAYIVRWDKPKVAALKAAYPTLSR